MKKSGHQKNVNIAAPKLGKEYCFISQQYEICAVPRLGQKKQQSARSCPDISDQNHPERLFLVTF